MKISTTIGLLLFYLCSFGQCWDESVFNVPGTSNVASVIEKTNNNKLVLGFKKSIKSTLILVDTAKNILATRALNGDKNTIFDLVVDKNNDTYICGVFGGELDLGNGFFFDGSSVADQFFVAKLDSNLNTLWAHVSTGNGGSSGHGNDIANSIAVDTNNNVFITGKFINNFVFQNQNISPNSIQNDSIFIAKLDASNGTLVWWRSNEVNQNFLLPYIKSDNLGGVYQYFNYNSGTYISQNGVQYNTTVGNNKVVITKFDNSGTQTWLEIIDTENNIISTDVLPSGNLLIYGSLKDTLSIQGNVLYNIANSGLFLGEISINGNCVWLQKIGTSSHINTITGSKYSLEYQSNGNYLISGTSLYDLNLSGKQLDFELSSYKLFVGLIDPYFTTIWAKSFGASNVLSECGIASINDCKANFYGYYKDSLVLTNDTTLFNSSFTSVVIEFDLNSGDINFEDNSIVTDPFGPNGVGINENEIDSILIFPNPTNSAINIEMQNNSGQFEGVIYDIYGVEIMRISNEKTIVLSEEMSNGVYFLKINMEDKIIVKSFMLLR